MPFDEHNHLVKLRTDPNIHFTDKAEIYLHLVLTEIC